MPLTFGQRAMLPRLRDLKENQFAIMRWLLDIGHKISPDETEFWEDVADDDYVWHFIR